jgi:microsomal dipeptidase-like Zn-dependent dipeptidase
LPHTTGYKALRNIHSNIKDVTGGYDNIAVGTDLDGFIQPIQDCQDWAQTPNLVSLIQARYPGAYEGILCRKGV